MHLKDLSRVKLTSSAFARAMCGCVGNERFAQYTFRGRHTLNMGSCVTRRMCMGQQVFAVSNHIGSLNGRV